MTTPKSATKAQRATHTTVDTIMITADLIQSWKRPGFQRPVRVNAKVSMIAERLKADGGVLPGMLTLGVYGGDTYIVDGQHRLEAFAISGLLEGFCDIRRCEFESIAAMAQEYIYLNSKIATMRPDDMLRGLEPSIPLLKSIREQLPFVGYDVIRRSEKSPILSMSILLRCWRTAGQDVPSSGGGDGVVVIAGNLSDEDVRGLVAFMRLAYQAWGRDTEYQRLWGTLNLVMVMWLYRRMVLGHKRGPGQRATIITAGEFGRALLALSATPSYLDWLFGRKLADRERAPAMGRIRALLAGRLQTNLKKKVYLPQESWMTGITHHQRAFDTKDEPTNDAVA